MPKIGGSADGEGLRTGEGDQWLKRLKMAGAITPGDHGLGAKILHRKTERVKFNGTVIVSGKLTNINEVFN